MELVYYTFMAMRLLEKYFKNLTDKILKIFQAQEGNLDISFAIARTSDCMNTLRAIRNDNLSKLVFG